MRVIAALTFPMLLSGCALPAAFSIATYAMDGLSLSASGKSVNDHMLSQLLDMDCNLGRLLHGDAICQRRGLDPDDDTLYLADAEPVEGPARPWGTAAEPRLDYGQDEPAARNWAAGVELAQVSIGMDPSARSVMPDVSQSSFDRGPQRIGEMSAQRDRRRRLEAVAERLERMRRPRAATHLAAAGEEALSARLAANYPTINNRQNSAGEAQSSSMPIIFAADRLDFGQSLGILKTASLSDDLKAMIATSAPVSIGSGNALIAASHYGPAWEYATTYAEHDEDQIALARPFSLRDANGQILEAEHTVAGTENTGDKPIPIATDYRNYYVVVGSFMEEKQARGLAERESGTRLAVVRAVVGQANYYRVLSGPFEHEQTADARRQLAAAGFVQSWILPTCRDARFEASCLGAAQVAQIEFGSSDDGTVQVAEARN